MGMLIQQEVTSTERRNKGGGKESRPREKNQQDNEG